MLPANAFIANEAHWITLDRRYLILVDSGLIGGMCVGGQLLPKPGRDYPTDPLAYAEHDALERYLALGIHSREFLTLDRRNFALSAPELRGFRISRRKALWTGPVTNSGSVVLLPRNERKRRLILLGHQDLDALERLLAAAGVPKLVD